MTCPGRAAADRWFDRVGPGGLHHSRAELGDLIAQAIRDAVAEEREACAQLSTQAYDEYWRLHKEHEKRWTAWKTGGEIGECPTINIGALPDFIASAIRSRANETSQTE